MHGTVTLTHVKVTVLGARLTVERRMLNSPGARPSAVPGAGLGVGVGVGVGLGSGVAVATAMLLAPVLNVKTAAD